MNESEWVRAAEAARMLGISRERVRQMGNAGILTIRRMERMVYVSVESIQARLADPWHQNRTGKKTEGPPKEM